MSEKIRKAYNRLSSEQKDEICMLYLDGVTCEEIGKRFSSDPSWIVKIVKRGGVWKGRSERYRDTGKYYTITEEMISELKRLNALNIDFLEISKKIGIPYHATKRLGYELGLKGPSTAILKRKCYLNQNWLDKIDCPEKAIYLGLFFADGCNQSVNNECMIQLERTDKDYLQRLNDLFTDKPLLKTRNMFRSIAVCPNWTKKLSEYGAVFAKSLILEWPKNIPDEFIKYFIRGFFEGDGGFVTSNRTTRTLYHMGFTSTKEFLESLKEILFKFLPLEGKLTICKCQTFHDRNTYSLKTNRQIDVKLIGEWIYSDKIEFAMERKYAIYQRFLKDRVKNGEIILYNRK